MYKYYLLFFVAISLYLQLNAQPESDIFVFDIAISNGEIALNNARNITKRKGYDNQPHILSDNRTLLYTAMEDEQTDIFSYDLKRKRTKQLTATAESEYSPTLMPNGTHYSVIQVEKDGTQRLWQFPLKQKSSFPELVLKEIKPVGYQAWGNVNQIALFILGEPNTLQLVEIDSETSQTLDSNIGRCLQNIPSSSEISYVQKEMEKKWFIKSFDLNSLEINTLATTLEGSEDYIWVTDKIMLMGQGSILYKFEVGKSENWEEVGDLSVFGIYQFNRMAISLDRKYLALVVTDMDD